MASEIQSGRSRSSSKGASSVEEGSRMTQVLNLRQVTELSEAEWLRIQDEMVSVHKEKDTVIEAVKQREAQHLKSKEMVKKWSNTIAAQRQKKLEARAIREEIEEEKRKLIDIEEAEHKEQKRKETVEKAKVQLYYETDRVKGFHRALLLSEVLKEREAQMELKQKMKNISDDVYQKYLDESKSKGEEGLRQEQEEAKQRKLTNLMVAGELKNRMKENEQTREQHRLDDKREGEKLQRLQDLYHYNQGRARERREKERRDLVQAHQDYLANKDALEAADAQRLKVEEEQRKVVVAAKKKTVQLWKDKEAQLKREVQMLRDSVRDNLVAIQQQQIDDEDQRTAMAAAEIEARQAALRRMKEEEKADMVASIRAHRETMKQENDERERNRQQDAKDTYLANREAYRLFTEKRQQKAQKNRETGRQLQAYNTSKQVEKYAKLQQERTDDHEYQEKNAQIIAEEEKEFQLYSRHIINAAAQDQKNVFPLHKAVRKGMGGGLGPIRPNFIVQDKTGVSISACVSATQRVKNIDDDVGAICE